jgi:hypothetical protein
LIEWVRPRHLPPPQRDRPSFQRRPLGYPPEYAMTVVRRRRRDIGLARRWVRALSW